MDLVSRNVVNQRLKPINPVQCGYERCRSGHSYGPFARTHWLLHYVVSGKGTFTTQRGSYKLGGGDMFIIKPYEITYYEADKTEPWSYVWLGFTSDIPLPNKLACSDTLNVPFLKDIFENACFTKEFDLSDTSCVGYEYYLCGAIWQICGLLQGDGKKKQLQQKEDYVRSAISTIETEYSSGITVSLLAERLHLNRSYFSETFKQITGMSPQNYLTDYRMRRAEELLCEHGYSVTVTAASVGYPDVFAFSRAFKRHFGKSPSYMVAHQKARGSDT